MKGVRAIDKDGYDIDIISVNGNLNVDEIGDYTLTYTASDIYGNTKSEDREVKVRPMVRGINIHGQEEDILIETHLYNHPNSGKVIKLKNKDLLLGKGDTFDIDDFISVEGGLGGYVNNTHKVSTSIPGFYRVEAKYRSHSAGADENSTVTFTVEVKNSSRPQINLNYGNTVEPTVGKEYTREMALQGVSIEDEEDNLKDKIEIIGLEDVNTTDDDTYSEITYVVTDSHGLKSTYNRTLATRHSPKIGRAEDITIEQNSDIDLYDIDVDDSVWYYGSVTVEGDNVVDGIFDTSKLGEHIVKYIVDDGEGRKTELERKITVVSKSNEKPVIHGVDGIFDTSKLGEHIVKYIVDDGEGRKTELERKITVVSKSNEKPVIHGADNITIKVGEVMKSL